VRYALLGSVLFTYSVAAVLFTAYQMKYFQITDVVVRGAETVRESEVLRLAGIKPGYSSIFFSASKAEAALKRDPWIMGARIKKVYPNRVVIEVEEARPYCLLQTPGGRLYYLSRGGDRLGEADFSHGLDFPILISNGKGSASQELVRSALELLRLAERSNVLRYDDVSQIELDPILGITLFTRDKRRIDFGTGDIVAKWSNVEKIITHSRSINLTEKYINIASKTTGVVNFNF